MDYIALRGWGGAADGLGSRAGAETIAGAAGPSVCAASEGAGVAAPDILSRRLTAGGAAGSAGRGDGGVEE